MAIAAVVVMDGDHGGHPATLTPDARPTGVCRRSAKGIRRPPARRTNREWWTDGG